MISNREAVYVALFALFNNPASGGMLYNSSTNPGGLIKKVSRQLVGWGDVDTADQPYLSLQHGGEKVETTAGRAGLPNKYVLQPKVYIYCHAANTTDGIVTTLLNNILDKLDAVLQSSGKPVTLGGLATSVQIAGEIITDEGMLGDQAMAIVPLEIVIRG